jgi:hypothetical protein
MSAAKRPARTQQKAQRAARKPAAAAQSSRGTRKATSSAAPRPKIRAQTSEAQQSRERLAEHANMLHNALATGVSAAAKAVRDAHSPRKRGGSKN